MKNTYWQNIYQGIKTSWEGLRISIKHLLNATKRHKPTYVNAKDYFDLKNGLVTVQYPHEKIPLPDQARYQLHNEMDDCIVCDKCAKICPVDCIEIEVIKATEQVGITSDGSPIRLYASKFDIDLAKCCYCGLCTTVCPTDCLTMTHEFDVSKYDTGELLAHFATLTPQEAQEKLDLLAIFQKEKELSKKVSAVSKSVTTPAISQEEEKKETTEKPKFIPKIKSPLTPKGGTNAQEEEKKEEILPVETPHLGIEGLEKSKEEKQETKIKEIPEKPKFIPKMKSPLTPKGGTNAQEEEKKEEILPVETPPLGVGGLEKPKFIPKMKPKMNISKNSENKTEESKEENEN